MVILLTKSLFDATLNSAFEPSLCDLLDNFFLSSISNEISRDFSYLLQWLFHWRSPSMPCWPPPSDRIWIGLAPLKKRYSFLFRHPINHSLPWLALVVPRVPMLDLPSLELPSATLKPPCAHLKSYGVVSHEKPKERFKQWAGPGEGGGLVNANVVFVCFAPWCIGNEVAKPISRTAMIRICIDLSTGLEKKL